MQWAEYDVRRATVDDLAQLGPLLQATLGGSELEKRLTEFQVVEARDGTLIAALGLQVAQNQGRIHGETFSDFALADTLRPKLWERVQSVARNRGLTRLWTDETAPFWKQNGFAPAGADVHQKFPPEFGEMKSGWLTLKLKDDLETIISMDKEFAMFMEAEKARTEDVLAQARMWKTVAYLLAFLMFGGVLVGSYYLLRHSNFFGSRF